MPSELFYPSGAASLNPNIVKASTFNSSIAVTIWTPVTGKSIVLFGLYMNMTSATTTIASLRYGGATTFFIRQFVTNSFISLEFQNGLRIFGVNDVIEIVPTAAMVIQYSLWGTEI